MNKNQNKKNGIRKFSKFLSIVTLIVLAIFLFLIHKVNILPSKYFTLITCVLVFLEVIYLLTCVNKKIKASVLMFMNVIAIVAIIVEGYGSYKIYQTYDFLHNNMQVQQTKDIYYIVVNSNSNYNDLKSIESKTVYYYNDSDDYKTLINNVKSKVSVVLDEVKDYSELMDSILEDTTRIILIDESSYEAYFENQESDDSTETISKNSFKILDNFEMVKELDTNDSTEDITTKPFIIYLSGIDTRTDSMPTKNLSDVNMFIVVNPETRKILSVNVPRDYYVQLHGTTGLKDKLTHAGMRGGVKLSKATMEDLLGYEADYYVRVNFKAVTKLVDAIGGITIDSKDNYTYTLRHGRNCRIRPGKNNLNASCALAFVRERYAYKTGDRHRGENQQQVIKAVIDKLSSSKTLIMKYDKILKALEGSFESNLSTNNITSLVQFQINDMRGWNFETSNLNGSGGMEPCYSFPNSKLSVMYQDQKTIDAAKAKIKEVLNEIED